MVSLDLGYKIYAAFIKQNGSDAPEIEEYTDAFGNLVKAEKNELNEPVTFEYVNDGIYKVVKPSGWNRLKTICISGNVGNGGNVTKPYGSIRMAFEGSDLLIYALDEVGTPINNQMSETPIKIIILN